jgi:hypothetical protein
MPKAKGVIRKHQVWRKRGDSVLQLAYRFHPLFISHSTCVYRGQKASNDTDHSYVEHAFVFRILAIRCFTSFKSRGVLRLPGFHITMSVVHAQTQICSISHSVGNIQFPLHANDTHYKHSLTC